MDTHDDLLLLRPCRLRVLGAGDGKERWLALRAQQAYRPSGLDPWLATITLRGNLFKMRPRALISYPHSSGCSGEANAVHMGCFRGASNPVQGTGNYHTRSNCTRHCGATTDSINRVAGFVGVLARKQQTLMGTGASGYREQAVNWHPEQQKTNCIIFFSAIRS